MKSAETKRGQKAEKTELERVDCLTETKMCNTQVLSGNEGQDARCYQEHQIAQVIAKSQQGD